LDCQAAVSHVSQDYVGRYRLLNLLRSGKTCQVWEALDDVAGERLAIKLLLSDFRHSREEVGYMRHEFEVGKNLHHPRVITIRDFGINRDNVYLAMELFPAPNIKQVIQQHFDTIAPLARQCMAQAAEGLAYFHEQGWIHRDIKPDNFLMKPTGEVKLIDFALAQRRRGGFMRLFSRTSTKIKGTRSYMAPEQIRGQSLDERADIYSLGCTFFEMLSGKPPFTGSTTAELLNKHLKAGVPSLQAVNRNASDGVTQLIKRMMAKAPEGRPRDCNAFLQEFRTMEVFKDS
jgi:eukaryotic-like serine/threonine-protein kinase